MDKRTFKRARKLGNRYRVLCEMLRRHLYGPAVAAALQVEPHTHTGPRSERLYGNRFDLLNLADHRFFLLHLAAFVDCDGHIAINKSGGEGCFRKTVSFIQKNAPYLNAVGLQINRHIPGVKVHRASGSRKGRRVVVLSYYGREAELILTALLPYIFWKHPKAVWLSLSATEANEANYLISHDYSKQQRRVYLSAYGGRDAVVNDWGFRESTQLTERLYYARAQICFPTGVELGCWLAAAFDFDGCWSGNKSNWTTTLSQKNGPALRALNARWTDFGFTAGRVYGK